MGGGGGRPWGVWVTVCLKSRDPREELSLGLRGGCALARDCCWGWEGVKLRDQVPLPSQLGAQHPWFPGLLAGGMGEVEVSALGLQALLLILEIFTACLATLETLMGDLPSFLKWWVSAA